MKRKLISTVLAVTGIVLVGSAVLLFLGFFKDQDAGILVESEPEATVYIDEIEVGKTPYEVNRKPGEVYLRIKPNTENGEVLDDYETKIKLVSGIKTIVKRVFNTTEEKTSGVVVSFEKLGGVTSYVTVVSVPDNAQVLIDNRSYGYTPLRVNIPAGDHTLIVSADKFKEKSLPIRVYAGYKLTASVKLAKAEEKEPEQLAVLGESEEQKSLGRIKINKTNVGYLRVRSGANTGFPEIAQVKPDEEYDILEEGEHGSWYKIKIVRTTNEGATDEIEGWVSSEFVTKLK